MARERAPSAALHGRTNILKRLLIHVGAFNISLLLRKTLGAGTPRELKDHTASLVWRLIACLTNHRRKEEYRRLWY
jgi:hypothetical protein